MKFIALFSDCC